MAAGISLTSATHESSFTIGFHIETLANLKVWSSASTNGGLLGIQGIGAFGTITSDPVSSDGYTWWRVNYDTTPPAGVQRATCRW